MKALKPNVDYRYVVAAQHVRNATDSKVYYFAILKEDENRFFDSWGRIDPWFDAEVSKFLIRNDMGSVFFSDNVNVFSLVDGHYIYELQARSESIVRICGIIRCSEVPFTPTKSLIAPVDYTDVYKRDMKKKRKDDIENKIREKKNKFVKEHLIDWMTENDMEANSLMIEYFDLTGHQFSF